VGDRPLLFGFRVSQMTLTNPPIRMTVISTRSQMSARCAAGSFDSRFPTCAIVRSQYILSPSRRATIPPCSNDITRETPRPYPMRIQGVIATRRRVCLTVPIIQGSAAGGSRHEIVETPFALAACPHIACNRTVTFDNAST